MRLFGDLSLSAFFRLRAHFKFQVQVQVRSSHILRKDINLTTYHPSCQVYLQVRQVHLYLPDHIPTTLDILHFVPLAILETDPVHPITLEAEIHIEDEGHHRGMREVVEVEGVGGRHGRIEGIMRGGIIQKGEERTTGGLMRGEAMRSLRHPTSHTKDTIKVIYALHLIIKIVRQTRCMVNMDNIWQQINCHMMDRLA